MKFGTRGNQDLDKVMKNVNPGRTHPWKNLDFHVGEGAEQSIAFDRDSEKKMFIYFVCFQLENFPIDDALSLR